MLKIVSSIIDTMMMECLCMISILIRYLATINDKILSLTNYSVSPINDKTHLIINEADLYP